jgi:hypothetical protein
MKSSNKWYHQVWVHCGQESAVHLVETYRERHLAEKSAAQRNAAERHDASSGNPPRRYYYVRHVTEEQLLLSEKEEYRWNHGEYRKHLVQKYNKMLNPLVREMATAMVFCLATCEQERLAMLHARGGWLEGYKGYADGIGDITFSLLYSGRGDIVLEIAIVYEGERDASEVETFGNENVLKSWLLNIQGASSACKNRIINMIYDMMIQRVKEEN